MTAINIRVTEDRAIAWADGLMYERDGTVFGFMNKARRLVGWKAVVLSTGLTYAGNRLAEILPTLASSFDEFRDDHEAILHTAMQEVQGYIDGSVFPRFAAFVVGWSDRESKPELIVYDDMGGTGEGSVSTTHEIISPKLFELEMQDIILALREQARKDGRNPTLSDAARLTMEAQRRHRANPEYAEDGFYVGGYITETVIDARGVREKVIHRWHDEIGEKVNPYRDNAANVVAFPGSRSERRRAEKLAKKKGRAA